MAGRRPRRGVSGRELPAGVAVCDGLTRELAARAIERAGRRSDARGASSRAGEVCSRLVKCWVEKQWRRKLRRRGGRKGLQDGGGRRESSRFSGGRRAGGTFFQDEPE